MPPRPPSDDSDEQSSDDELTDWPPTDSGQPDSNPPWILLGVGGPVAVAIGWFFRPWLHGLIYTVYTTPLLLLGIVAGSVAAWVTARSGGRVEIVVNTLSSSDHTITPPRVGVVVRDRCGCADARRQRSRWRHLERPNDESDGHR